MDILLSISLALLILIPIGALFVLATPVLFRGGPYVATSEVGVAKTIELLKLQPGEVFIDLGSGDGRLLLAAAQVGTTVIGYETNPWLVMKSRQLLRRAGFAKKSQIIWGNLWRADLSKGDAISIFILPNLLEDLAKKLKRECKKGSRIVTIGWPISAWQPIEQTKSYFLYHKMS